jgi:hypothetical protein
MGNEGMIGIPIILTVKKTPHRVTVQISGDTFRIKVHVICAEFKRGGELHLLLSYERALLTPNFPIVPL